MKRTVKTISFQFLSAFLAFLMMFYLIPVTVFAKDTEEAEVQSQEQEQELLVGEDQVSDAFLKSAFELIDRRDESVKHFRLSDGTYVAVQYQNAVHYQNEKGEWTDIDNTLQSQAAADSDDFAGYEALNGASVKFANNTSSSKTFSIKNGDYKISLGLIDANKGKVATVTNPESLADEDPSVTSYEELSTLTKLVSKVVYANAYDNTDIEYVLLGNNIKENIIIKQNGAQSYAYSFEMKLNGLTAVLNENGSISLCDEESGEPVYTMPAPFMFDANGEFCNDVAYTLTQKNQKYTITVTADAEWINAPERALPITVDPTVQYGTSGTDFYTESTYVNSDSPTTNYASDVEWYVGKYSSGGQRIGYNKINQITGIPNGAVITQASFRVQGYGDDQPEDVLTLREVTSSWDVNTITYSRSPSVSTAILDYQRGNVDVFEWDITELVKKWVQNPSSNYGVQISYVTSSTSGRYKHFYKMSAETLADRPYYEVRYQDTKGVEDYYNYYGSAADGAGNGYVNAFTGQLSFLHNSLSTTDSLMPYTFGLAYNGQLAGLSHTSANSASAYSTAYAGKGFKLYSDESIKMYASVPYFFRYVWMDADGTEHYFVYQDDVDGNELKRRYVDEDGLKLTLIVTLDEEGDEQELILSDDLGNEKGFDYYGRLAYIKDANGNKRTFNRSGEKLTSISLTPNINDCSTFTQLSFTYNSSNLLQQVSNEQNDMTADFYYSATYNGSVSQSNSGFLRKIVYTYSLGYTHTVTFEYDSSGRLTVAKDLRTGKAVGYTYNTAGLVSKITEYAGATESNAVSAMTEGQSASIAYGVQKTTYSAMGSDNILGTADDLKTVYQFDHTGKVISAYSHIGNELYGASNYVYESEESIKTKNSLASVLTLGGSAVNLLCDPGFDNITNINSDSNWSASSNVTTPITYFNGIYDRTVTMQINDSKRYASIEQAVTLSEGSYTFSVMVNPEDLTENARVRLIVCDYEYELWENSDYLYWQDFGGFSDKASQWEQLSVTFDVPSYYEGYTFYVAVELGYLNSSNSGTCTAVIDSAMLERGKGASTFSLLGNGAFEQGDEESDVTTDWSYSTGYPLTGGIMSSQYCAEVFGNASSQRSTQTTLNLNHTQSTLARSFVVSGWGKANSAKTKYPQDYVGANGNNPVFAIKVVVSCYNGNYEDGKFEIPDLDDTYDTVYYIPFNDQNTDWQFASGVVNVSDGEYLKSITVHACYDYNVNQAYFDDFSIVENSGAVTNYTYNANGYMESAYASDGTKTTYTYAPNGVDVTNISNSAGGNYGISNDSQHRVNNVMNTNGDNYYSINYTYNGVGLVEATEMFEHEYNYEVIYSASTYATNNAYFGATLTETDPTGATTEYCYDSKGRLYSVCDANGNGLIYSYNQFGQLSGVEFAEFDSAEGEMLSGDDAAEVTNTYNNEGRLATITTDTATYTFEYDAFGNTTNIKVNGQSLASYEYKEKNGVLLSMDYGNGCSVEYLYDGVDRIVGICYNGSTEARFAYTYNANGNVTRHEDLSNGLEYQYSYDGSGKLLQTTVHKTGTQNELFYLSKYEYDDQGRVTEVYNYYCTNTNAAPLSFTTYEYDVEGNVKKLHFNNSASVDYTRDYFGRLARKELKDGSTEIFTQRYSYSSLGNYQDNLDYSQTTMQVSQVTLEDASGTEYTTYSYDAVGNITGIRRYNSSGTLSQYSYEYDELGQLTRENIYIPSNTSATKTFVYAYDKAGNILSKTTYPYTTGTLGTATKTINYQYTSSAWGDLLTKDEYYTISYDAIGNALNLNSILELRWEGRQLKEIYDIEDHYSYTYAYNDEGVRISKNANGVLHEYIVNGTQIEREVIYRSGSSTSVQFDLRYFYDAEGNPTAIRLFTIAEDGETTSELYYLGTNLQGDVVAIYNSAGTKICSYEYDAWGNTIKTSYLAAGSYTIGRANPFRYRGYYYDAESGLYYLNSRYYNPNWGRFINADHADVIAATPEGLTDKNLFAYCDNNPITREDGDGEFWNVLIGAAVGAVVGAVVSVVSQVVEAKGDFSIIKESDFLKHVAVSAASGAVTGAVAATGIGLAGQVACNAGMSVAGSLIDSCINDMDQKVTLDEAKQYGKDALVAGVIGVGSGLLGGKGTGTSHLRSSFSRTLGNGNWSYYFTQTKTEAFRVGVKAIPAILKGAILPIGNSFLEGGW